LEEQRKACRLRRNVVDIAAVTTGQSTTVMPLTSTSQAASEAALMLVIDRALDSAGAALALTTRALSPLNIR
jgi:hypothetical protein